MKLHFIGIGGIGMSALARLHSVRGDEISGSDATDSSLLEALRDEGIGVFIGHSEFQVPPDVDRVVYSEAIALDNLELKAARERGLLCQSYFEALGEWTLAQKAICVAGTHGKTTTTGLIARLLLQAYRDPTVVIGSQMPELDGKNMRLGEGEWMVVEACEYRRSFLHLSPRILVLTNIELDHVDYYRDLEDYLDAFRAMVQRLPADGFLIANGDDSNVRAVAEGAPCPVFYFDETSPHLGKLELSVPGQHNRMNALAAFTVGLALGIEEELMVEALNGFSGTWRRFEYKGDFKGAFVYDDYAHHPTEIQATLQGAREKYPDRRLIAVFQPHQFSRARHFTEAFAESFRLADAVVIPNIYGARDSQEDREAMSVGRFVEALQKHHPSVRDGGGLESTVELLRGEVGEGDLVLVMGAGDVWKVAEGLIS